MCTSSCLSIIPACPSIFPFLCLLPSYLFPSTQFVCLRVCPFCLSCRSIYVFIHRACLSASISACLTIHLSACLSLLSAFLPICLSPSTRLVYQLTTLSVWSSVYLLVCPFCLSAVLSVCHHPHILLSVHKSMRLATCLRQHRCQEDPEFPIQFPFLTVSSHKTPKERLIEENYLPWKQKSGRCMVCSHKQYLQWGRSTELIKVSSIELIVFSMYSCLPCLGLSESFRESFRIPKKSGKPSKYNTSNSVY